MRYAGGTACGSADEDEQHVLLDCPYYVGVCAKFADVGSNSCVRELFGLCQLQGQCVSDAR